MEHLVTRDGRLRLWTMLRRVRPEDAFAYWTEADKLAAWWPDGAGVNPREAEPGRRLVYSLRDGATSSAETNVVVDFERRDDDTLLTVTQGPNPEGAEAGVLERWTERLARLRRELTRAA